MVGRDGRVRRAAARRLDPDSRTGLLLTLWGVATLLGLVVFGVLIALVREHIGVTSADHAVADRLNTFALAHHTDVRVLRDISTVGAPRTFYVLVGVLAVVLLLRRAYRLAVWAGVTMAGAALLDVLIKNAVGRTRPTFLHAVAAAPGKSFPSGHALESFVGCGIVLLVALPAVRRPGRFAAFGVAALVVLAIGFSRIGLGVHYLSDVVGGWIFGAGWLSATVAAFRLWRHRHGRGDRPVTSGLDAEQTDRLVSP
jgi:membrane-associated phospholipid phosphatase